MIPIICFLGQMLYHDVAVLSEEDFERIVGLPIKSFKDLKKKMVEIESAEGTKKTVLIASLRGLPLDEILAIKKMRLWHNVGVGKIEHLLQPEFQFHKLQGKNWLSSILETHLQSRPSSMKASGESHLLELPEYISTAKEVMQQRQDRAEEARRGGNEQAVGRIQIRYQILIRKPDRFFSIIFVIIERRR